MLVVDTADGTLMMVDRRSSFYDTIASLSKRKKCNGK